MSNKEILEQICKDDEIDYISFEDDKFIVKFGDVENTDRDGYKYKLLDSYIQMDYGFKHSSFRLHRGIIDIKECFPEHLKLKPPVYSFSGFVHCQNKGVQFCYGASGIEPICAEIQMEGLTSDRFNLLLLRFGVYLSNSSHNTMGNESYRRLNVGDVVSEEAVNLKAIRDLDGVKWPYIIEKVNINSKIESIDYTKPYQVITQLENLKFEYMGKEIIPTIVKHKLEEIVSKTRVDIKVNIAKVLEKIELESIKQTKYEVNNTRDFNIEDFIHQFTD